MTMRAEEELQRVGPPLDPGGRGDREPEAPIEPKIRAPKILTSPHPTDEEIRKVGEILSLFDQAKNHRRPIVARWYESYRMLRNKFWPTDRPSWMPAPQIPEILPIVEALVAWEMDQRPRYTIAPMSLPHDTMTRFMTKMAQDLEAVLDASWQGNIEEREWGIATWDKYVYGTGITKTTWDQTISGGMGDAMTRRVPLFAFYPDPHATSTDDASYFIEVRRMSIQELDRNWPGTGAMFHDGGVDLESDLAPNQIDQIGSTQPPRANPGALSPATTPRYNMPGSGRISVFDTPGVTVIECWTRDHEVYEATDIHSRETIPRVYDKWRVQVVAGNRLILDEPAENLWSSGSHPYDRLVRYDTGEFWGFSLVEDLSSAQKHYNRTLAAMQQNVELAGNPVLKDAGTGRTGIYNKPGFRLETNPASAKDTSWMPPPPLHQAMPELLRHYPARMEAIAGLTAVMKGHTPTGRNAQGVVDAMQEAGFVRVRSSLRHLEYAMRSAGAKKADLIIENYTTPRIVSIAGAGAQRTSLALRSNHFQIPSSKGSVPLKYRLFVDAGSRAHTSRQMREDRAVQLFILGALDVETLLEEVNFPNAPLVAQKVKQQMAEGQMEAPGKRERARA